jgi:hypothetical protein
MGSEYFVHDIYRAELLNKLCLLNKRTLENFQASIVRNKYNFMGEIPIYGRAKNIDALKPLVLVAMGGIEPPTPAL